MPDPPDEDEIYFNLNEEEEEQDIVDFEPQSIKEKTTDLSNLENLLLIQTAVKVISSLLLIFINLLNKWILLQFQTRPPNDFPLKSRSIDLRIENIPRLPQKHISRYLLLKQLIRRILMKKHTITNQKVLDRWSVIIIIIQRYIFMTKM